MELGLSGRRILVLGSTAGLGRAVAVSLAGEGARIGVSGRDPKRAADTAASLPGAVDVVGDLRDLGVPERVVQEAVRKLGGLDGLVVNTGGAAPGWFLQVNSQDEEVAFAGVLRPALAAARAAVPWLQRSDLGRMVFIAARSALETTGAGAFRHIPHGSGRGGPVTRRRTRACRAGQRRRAGAIRHRGLRRFESNLSERTGASPSEVRQRHVDGIPMGRLERSDELADMVTFLCSARASYVTGGVIRVDGGAVRGF